MDCAMVLTKFDLDAIALLCEDLKVAEQERQLIVALLSGNTIAIRGEETSIALTELQNVIDAHGDKQRSTERRSRSAFAHVRDLGETLQQFRRSHGETQSFAILDQIELAGGSEFMNFKFSAAFVGMITQLSRQLKNSRGKDNRDSD